MVCLELTGVYSHIRRAGLTDDDIAPPDFPVQKGLGASRRDPDSWDVSACGVVRAYAGRRHLETDRENRGTSC